jgi:hypothetical protein
MTEPLSYKLDVNKIQTLEDVRNIFKGMCLMSNVGKDHPDYELLKEYFTIPYVPEPLKMNWEGDKDNA